MPLICGVSMATALDPKQMVSSEELLMSQVVSQDALIRLLIQKAVFTQEEFLEMMRVVNKERKKKLQRRLDETM